MNKLIVIFKTVPRTCAVTGCSNRGDRDGVYWFRFPQVDRRSRKREELSKKRQAAWLNALKRADLVPEKWPSTVVCSQHFISGRSADLLEENSQDWVPNQNLDNENRMARRCVVKGCGSSKMRPEPKLFTFPAPSHDTHTNELSSERRKRWLKALQMNENTRFTAKRFVCSLHFVSGKPSRLTDNRDVDWVPTLALPPKSAATIDSTAPSSDDEHPTELLSEEPIKINHMDNSFATAANVFLGTVGSSKCEGIDEGRCEFCLKLPEEEPQIPVLPYKPWYEPKIRKTIEFVLARTLQAITIKCCNSCWRLFESFYQFKTNCLAALKARYKTLNTLKLLEHQKPKSKKESLTSLRDAIFCRLCNEQFKTIQEKKEHKRYCFDSSDSEDDADDNVHELWQNYKNLEASLQESNETLETTKNSSNTDETINPQVVEFLLPPDYAFSCEKCSKQFSILKEAIDHKTHCFDLSESKPATNIADPVDTVDELQADCAEDDKRFHFKEGFIFCCIRCKQTFAKLLELRRHYKVCTEPIDPEAYELELDERDNRYHCKLCPFVNKIKHSMRVHMNRHYGIKRYQCRKESCQKKFFCKSTQIVHEKDCGKTQNYVCNVCGAQLKSFDTLRIHMRKHGPPRYHCMICNKDFRVRHFITGHWKTHFRQPGEDSPNQHQDADYARVEKLPRTIPCEICKKKLPTESVYVRHRRFCNDLGNYPKASPAVGKLLCPHCPKRFRSETKRQYHIDQHNGIRSVPCRREGCTRMSFNISARNAHELDCGKSWMCNVCGQMFSNRCTLNSHMLGHTGNAPKCEICGKTFAHKRAMQVHQITHTGEKNHECKLCGQKFTQASSVKTHMKIHARKGEVVLAD